MRKFILLFLLGLASSAFSEDHRIDAKFIFGTSAFLDEDIPFDHSIFGGSVPFRISKRISVEPQFLYMNGPGSDRDITLTGNVIYDFVTGNRFTFYLVGGAGLIRHTERFATGDFTASEWTANGGIGAKIFLNQRLFLAPEFRFGSEPFLTTTVAIGYRF